MSAKTTEDSESPSRWILFSTWSVLVNDVQITSHHLQICATHGLQTMSWRLIWPYQVQPNGLCSGVQKYYPNTQRASGLRDPEPSKAKTGRENNQHLRWEQSTDTESEEWMIWNICEWHSAENYNTQMREEWCKWFVAAQESCRTIAKSTTLRQVHNALPYYTHTHPLADICINIVYIHWHTDIKQQ